MIDRIIISADHPFFDPHSIQHFGCFPLPSKDFAQSIECRLTRSGKSFDFFDPFSVYERLGTIFRGLFTNSPSQAKISVNSPLLKVNAILGENIEITLNIEYVEKERLISLDQSGSYGNEEYHVKIKDRSAKDLEDSTHSFREFTVKDVERPYGNILKEITVNDQKCYLSKFDHKKFDLYISGMDPLSDPDCQNAETLKKYREPQDHALLKSMIPILVPLGGIVALIKLIKTIKTNARKSILS